jgi:hypothetical protein
MLSHNINDISVNTSGFSIVGILLSLPYILSPKPKVRHYKHQT